ncbi:MAG: 2-amino-4-hydroxy-6-hydroxymethyldihydropteridine diphosphokinase, partial [Loktanella sp.]|nr:2-amino-4-hydroxy-6-hydroxymethyldihydropteridine diphosphokinase [Loktanella sp.]
MLGHIALIAAGSNQSSCWGDPPSTITGSVDRLSIHAIGEIRRSALYATPAFPAGAGPDFVNAAFAFATALDADALLAALHAIEAEAGRSRAVRWGQRTLDLDLIALGDQVAPDLA